MAVQIEQSSFVTACPESANDTFARGSPFELTLTAWVSNNQVDSANLSSATISDYVGNWLEFLDGNVRGEWSRIRTFDGTNTVTLDPVSVASPTATRARMWVPPEPIVNATSNGNVGGTTVVSTSRTEADDYWNDPDRLYLMVEGAGGAGSVARGEARLVADFDAATDTFTVATAFSSQVTTGDLLVLRQPLKPASAEITLPEAGYTFIDRRFVKGDWDRDPGVQGPRSGSFELALEVKGASAASTTGPVVAAAPTEAADFLDSISAVDPDSAGTTLAGGSTTSIVLTAGHGARFAVGNLVLVNGEVTGITAISTDTLTVSPALSVAPAASVTVFGGVNYKPQTSGFRSHTVEMYLDDIRRILYGWHFDLTIEGLAANEIPRFKFTGPFDAHITQDVAPPYTPTFDTKVPRAARASRLVLAGSTTAGVMGASLTLGYEIEPVGSLAGTAHGKNGHIVKGRNTQGTLKIWAEDANLVEDFERESERELLIQVGSTTTDTVAVWCPAIQYSGVTVGREAGGYVYDVAFNVLRSNITSVQPFVITAF